MFDKDEEGICQEPDDDTYDCEYECQVGHCLFGDSIDTEGNRMCGRSS